MEFRELACKNKQLGQEECIALLRQQRRGVLSVLGEGGYPYGLPINHFYCPEDGKIYFHSGMTGHKVEALQRCGKASFCVYDQGFCNPGEWALNIRSVVVFGHVEPVENRAWAMEVARRLSREFTQDESYIEEEIARHGSRTLVLALTPEHITGKLVREA